MEHFEPGMIAFDHWTSQVVTVVSGAQCGNHVTIKFRDNTTATVRSSDLSIIPPDRVSEVQERLTVNK